MRFVLAALLAACAVDAPELATTHPANPAAPIGRLAPMPDAFGSGSATPPPAAMKMKM
ncbi:MAG TPA: hypothetical protein VH143_35630 [Kofleriaceae bacterium]|nr:hypothetical protein [Kofleriaceae bacterium]